MADSWAELLPWAENFCPEQPANPKHKRTMLARTEFPLKEPKSNPGLAGLKLSEFLSDKKEKGPRVRPF